MLEVLAAFLQYMLFILIPLGIFSVLPLTVAFTRYYDRGEVGIPLAAFGVLMGLGWIVTSVSYIIKTL